MMRSFILTVFLLLSSVCFAALALPASSFGTDSRKETPSQSREHKMYMDYPAVDWREALPAGNGDMGAMLYGNVVRERVMLNDKRFFYLRNHKELPDFSMYLSELRRMMDDGFYEEADKFYMSKIRESGYANTRSGIFQPGFDLDVTRSPVLPFTNYQRTLDFETGVATVEWNEGETWFKRSLFVSRADNVTVLRLSAGSNRLCGEFTLAPHDFKEVVEKALSEDAGKFGLSFEHPVVSEDGFICISGMRNDDRCAFGAVAKVIPSGGQVEIKKNGKGARVLSVSGVNDILVLVKLFYKGQPGQRFLELKQQINELPSGYDRLLARHTKIHRELFLRCELDLQAGEKRSWSNERLLAEAYKGKMPDALVERMFDYGRYLLICSSNPEGLPANLQGVWNGLYNPPWQGSFFFNENIQMNYWQALQGNMPELLLSLFNLVEKGLLDFRENARKYYGCRGILTPIRMIDDFGRKTGAIPQDVFYTGGAGWLAQFFYDYWLFTGDDEFLKNRAVPYMKEVALFYEDFVTIDKEGHLKMYPSNSPENTPEGRNTQLCINATMDFAIMKELLSNLVHACEYLKIDKNEVKRWKKLLLRIPAYQVNENGALKEWMHPGFPDNYYHRHQSHIYPLFPGFEITKESNPRLFEACRIAVERRKVIGIESQTGWSLAHMANIYARLHDSAEAWDCLNLMTRSTVGNNLFTYHNDYRMMGITSSSFGWPPFQIDANLGYTAAVQEMLVYSNPDGYICLLPALPAYWQNGSIRGVRCRGGFELDLEWKNGEIQSATIKSLLGKSCRIFYKDRFFDLHLKTGESRLILNAKGIVCL